MFKPRYSSYPISRSLRATYQYSRQKRRFFTRDSISLAVDLVGVYPDVGVKNGVAPSNAPGSSRRGFARNLARSDARTAGVNSSRF